MKTLTTIVIALALSAGTAPAQALPQPKAGSPGGSCPFGYTSSGAFCIPSQGGQQAVPLPPNGSCPWGWTRSGSYCLRSGRDATTTTPSRPADDARSRRNRDKESLSALMGRDTAYWYRRGPGVPVGEGRGVVTAEEFETRWGVCGVARERWRSRPTRDGVASRACNA